ncbi:thiol-activated cytolysin family protein [Runella limosa]|uniref:thiol-activated cytolysin family protein n=1 Tax=Runella limosa TaxID=370978 RepID=UPI00041238CD|nr:thiol-activated cytolysin family protein [Runella limosa]
MKTTLLFIFCCLCSHLLCANTLLGNESHKAIKVYGTILLKKDAGEMRDIKVAELGNPTTPQARFRAVNDYANRNGFLGAFPNFHEANYNTGHVYGVCLIRKEAGEWRDVKATDLGNPTRFEEFFRAVNDYAYRNGFVGGFANFYEATYTQGKVYGVILIKKSHAEWRDISANDLNNPTTPEARFRETQGYASANHFLSGFPNFYEAEKPNIVINPDGGLKQTPSLTISYKHIINNTTVLYSKSNQEATNNYRETTDKVNEEGQRESNGKIINCRTEFKTLNFESIDQDVVDNSTINRFYPGAVFDLYDVQKVGEFKEINKEKNPLNVSILASTVSSPTALVETPTVNSIRNTLGELMNRKATGNPKTVERTLVTEVYSKEDFRMKLGLNVSYLSAGLNTLFDFGNGSERRKFLMDYKSEWFSVLAEPTTTLFKDKTVSNSLVYVDKVIYGVRILVAFEDENFYNDFTNNTDVKYSSGALSAKVNMEISDRNKYQNTSFKVFTWGAAGGTSGRIASVRGYDALMDELNKVFNEMKQWDNYPSAWGTPIAYSLRFLDGSIAMAQAGLENIPRRICDAVGSINEITLDLNSVASTDGGFYGSITLKLFDKNNQEILPIDGNKQPLINVPERAKTNVMNNPNISRVYKLADSQAEGAYFQFFYNIWDYDSGSGNDFCRFPGDRNPKVSLKQQGRWVIDHTLEDDTDDDQVKIQYTVSRK